MADDSIKKTVVVALGVCLVCSLLVSTAAVTLNSLQVENKRLDKVKNILIAGDLYGENVNIAETYESKVKPAMIDLSSGETLGEERFNDVLNIESFDIKTMAGHPEYGRSLPREVDLAQVGRIPRYMLVYLVEEGGALEKVILPVYGKGLWSTMYGFLALGKDLKTVTGITFYEHGETPGLGGEIENPRWTAIWKGKQAFDEGGSLAIEVLKGAVDAGKPEAIYRIDGMTGATITTRGVDQLVKFWLGDNGYGPFLKSLEKGGGNE